MPKAGATDPLSTATRVFDEETGKVSCLCLKLAYNAITTAVSAARTEIAATKPEERPFSVHTSNIFNAPVGAVAQNHALISSVTQTNSADTRAQLHELIPLIKAIITELAPDNQQAASAALQTIETEAATAEPDREYVRPAVVRIASFIERSASSAAGGALLAYLKFRGWIP